ncbi:hypothetical protein [Aeoliella sp.]|uniref:hypothetical protein n=1 Tax=Aeoliella sp. TaxID=2795800 RepID=UPI003CCC14D8
MATAIAAGAAASEPAAAIDREFITTLSTAGVLTAAEEMGLDASTYLLPLAERVDHPYRQYRWSVDYAPDGSSMINALPPEEEVGWIPWERWWRDGDTLRHESWVLYPIKRPSQGGMPRWYQLDEEASLYPRMMFPPKDIEEKLRLARVDEAARVLGFDHREVLLEPLSAKGRARYLECRWVVIPHILGADQPVIYSLPPMHRSDTWPWETWYTDGKRPLILHVHYTAKSPLTTGEWTLHPGAPQRPAELFGRRWYWYDKADPAPVMSNP